MSGENNIDYYLAELEKIFKTQKFKEDNNELTEENLFFQLQDEITRLAGEKTEKIISIAFKIEQIAINLNRESPIDDQKRNAINHAFENAAKIFEQLAETEQIADKDLTLDLYLHSAIDYSLGEFLANARVIANKALRKFSFERDIHSLTVNIAFLLLQNNLSELLSLSDDLLEKKDAFEQSLILDKEKTEIIDSSEIVENISHFILIEGINLFANYLITGDDALYSKSIEKVGNSINLFTSIKDIDNFVLSKLVFLFVGKMHYSSIWNQLGTLHNFKQNPILNRYLSVLSSDRHRPIYELWYSQIEALPKILGNEKTTVLQMPTSAGKTRIAEIKIVETLATNPPKSARCIYIAPFKALAKQVEESLDHYLRKVGFTVTSINGGYEGNDFEISLTERSDVLVITPEKLDYLFRANQEFFNDVKLIIIDEGHVIDNGVRGLRLELLLYRIKEKYSRNGLKFYFISAVIPNSNEVAAWLSQGDTNLIPSDWKPTKLRQGIFYWDAEYLGKIKYSSEDFEISTKIKRKVLRDTYKNDPSKKLAKPEVFPDGANEIAIELALDYLKSSPTIIFSVNRKPINSIAQRLLNQIQQRQSKDPNFSLVSERSKKNLEELSLKVEAKLGRNFPLAVYIRNGFAYHHGTLPDDLREEIEYAFRNHHLRILIATRTLAQGINLPVKLLLVTNLNSGEESPFLVRDFRNIAGRAGRALHETEGNVIYIQNTQDYSAAMLMNRYFDDKKNESVKSVISDMFNDFLQKSEGISLEEYILKNAPISIDFESIESNNEIECTFQNQLLAMLFEDILDEKNISTIQFVIDHSLFGVQWKESRDLYRPLVEYTDLHINKIATQLKTNPQRKAYYQAGFSINSCVLLEKEITKLAIENAFSNLRDPASNSFNSNVLEKIMGLIYLPSETNRKHSFIPSNFSAMLLWISYSSIDEICQNLNGYDVNFNDPLFVSNLIYSHFVNDFPWALNAIIKIIDYLKEVTEIKIDPEFYFLPSYLKYGVNTPIASYVCEMGITNRNIAKSFSDLFFAEQGKGFYLPSLIECRVWINNLNLEDLKEFLPPEMINLTWATIRKFQSTRSPIINFLDPSSINLTTFVVGLKYEDRLENLKTINAGDILRLIREPDNAFDDYALSVFSHDGKKLGYIQQKVAYILSTLIDEGKSFKCMVIKKNSSESNPNKKLLVSIKSQTA